MESEKLEKQKKIEEIKDQAAELLAQLVALTIDWANKKERQNYGARKEKN